MRRYDALAADAPEMSASAVSPFCKSFSFLCHVRCLQRGDPHNAGNIYTNSGGGEINRCLADPSPSARALLRVLCICNNGVDLTAEVSYALEGVTDMKAGGGGSIRTVVYETLTKTTTRYQTKTTTLTSLVISTKTETRFVKYCPTPTTPPPSSRRLVRKGEFDEGEDEDNDSQPDMNHF
ncbi:hypothetical protein BG004_001201 [Podila humilis]|nr:hypothetical protein BG004_001201 [Podila humilis]